MDKNILIKKIALEGKKISDLDLTEHISGEELLEVTQDNKSKAVSIDTILESASIGIIKIPRKDITLDKAISLVKDYQKSFGTIIHFHNVESDSWEMYRYTNPSIKEFDDITNWEYINISNTFKGLFPTEKDLLLKFPKPVINDYALVGNTVDSADTYFANKPGTWEKSNNKIKNKLCRFKGITSRDANIKLECSPKQSNSTCSRPYRRGNSVYWRLEDGSEEWLFDVTDDVYLVCPETPDEEVFDVFVRTTEGGSYSPYPVITPVPANTTITVTATPEEGYVFKHWDLGNIKVTTPTFTHTITDDFLALGVFENIKEEVPTPPTPTPITKYTITTSTAGGGITTPSSISVEEHTIVEIAAIPNEGKVFKHWLLNNTIISNSAIYQVPATSDEHYIAVFEDKPVSPTPPDNIYPVIPGSFDTPKPTPTITYSIEADTTPISITIDDTTQEREVCFSYKVVKNTTLEGNTTNEYVSDYTSNRDKDRFCVTTSNSQVLPLEVNVDGTVLNKTFTINVIDNRTPDKGFFEVDYPNSTGIEETPEGPRLINQCSTDGTGGTVTYTIKLTERSNPFVGIPENLPQGIEVTLSEDKKTMTIKTICDVISQAVGKIFDVFDFFKRKIQVLLGTAKEAEHVEVKFTVEVIHDNGEDPEETEVYEVDAQTSFEIPYKYKDSHDISSLSINDIKQPSQVYNFAYVVEGDTVIRVIYKRKDVVEPTPPEFDTTNVTISYSFVDVTDSSKPKVINFSKPSEEKVVDLIGDRLEFTAPDIAGYSYVSGTTDSEAHVYTERTFSTWVSSDTVVIFNYTKNATDSYGKDLPFEFQPAIINALNYNHFPTVGTPNSTYITSHVTFGLVAKNKGVVNKTTNILPTSKANRYYPIVITDGVNSVSLNNKDYSLFPSSYGFTKSLPFDKELYFYSGTPAYNYNNNDTDYSSRLAEIKETTVSGVKSANEVVQLPNTSNKYPKKELTITLNNEVYRFKSEDVLELNVALHNAHTDGYRKGIEVVETEDLVHAAVYRDITISTPTYTTEAPVPPTTQPPTTNGTTPPAEEDTTDYSGDVVRPSIELKSNDTGDDGLFNYIIAYPGVEQNIQSITWDIPSLGINSGRLTNNSGFSFPFSVNTRITESTLDVHQTITFVNNKNYAETYTLTGNAMFGYE